MENSNSSREQTILQFFNPNDLTLWQDKPIEEFVASVVHELKMERESIQKYAELLIEVPEMQSITWTTRDETITAERWLQAILKSTRVMDIILDTLRAYGKEISEEKD